MAATQVLILGCGYTGKRVARTLAQAGINVIATTRNASALDAFARGNRLDKVIEVDVTNPSALTRLRPFNSPDFAVLHSIPTVEGTDTNARLMTALSDTARVVYLSTTGVYGSQVDVDQSLLPQPATPREFLRVSAERSVAQANSFLVLRPAAIYGPFRGIHYAIREGKYQLAGDGKNFVSRIHVDDLVTHCVAGLFSTVTGAWPVADEEPCESREIAAFCSSLLALPLPPKSDAANLGETRRANRRVDGSAIRQLLGIQLRYPSYRVGIPACVAAEALDRDF